MTRLRLLTLTAMAALAIASCGGDGEASSSTTSSVATTTTTSSTTTSSTTTTTMGEVPDGVFVTETNGLIVSFNEPEGFIPIDLTKADVAEVFAELEGEGVELNDEFRTVVEQAMAQQGVDFIYWGFDFEGGTTEFVPNVNVLQLPAGPFDRIEVYLEILDEQYAELGLTLVEIEEIEVAAGPAVLAISAPPEDWVEYVSVQLLVPTDDWVFTTSFSYADQESIDMDVVMDTFLSFDVEPVG